MVDHQVDAVSLLIVIPCLNEELYVEKRVQEALNENLPALIVIADGGSTDQTPTIGRRLASEHSNVVFLQNPKRIQSAAVNLAVATYGQNAKYLIRIDAHCDYPPHYCQTLIQEAEDKGADSVVVAMKTEGKAGFQKIAAAVQNSKLGNGGSAHRMAGTDGKWVDHGHHALMRIAAYQKVGGYDEVFTANEDAELDTRLIKAGFKIWLTGKTVIIYYPRSSAKALFRQYFLYGWGRAQNIIKHGTIPKVRQLAPAAVLPAAMLALLSPFIWIAALPLLAWAFLCIFYGVLFAIKTKNLENALIGPMAMLMHFGWSLGFWSCLPNKRARGS